MPALPFTFEPGTPPDFLGLPPLPAIIELQGRKQWVAWRYEDRGGNLTKPPVSPRTGYGASHSNPGTWGTYQEAESRALADGLPGVGYVISEADNLTGADLDKCRDPDTGQVAPWVAEILSLAETYAEVSPSGTGIRLIWRGKIAKTVKCDPAHVELYRSHRYLTITGDHLPETPTEIRPAPKTEAALVARAEAFKPKAAAAPATGLSGSTSFFRTVNDKALTNLQAWVPMVFGPAAQFQFGTGAYRVSSRSLGRDLQEDLSLAPTGIVDFGVHDLGDANQGRRTAIDIVWHYLGLGSPKDAAFWLCERLGARPEDLGWQALPPPDPVARESQRNLAAQVAPSPETDDPPETAFEARFRFSDLSALEFETDPLTPKALGGTLQWITEETLAMARRPVPAYATLAAIMFGGVMFGRAWRGFTNTSLSLFSVIAGRSGQGKSWPVNAVRLLASECGLADRIGGRQPTSDSAIEKRLGSSPVLTYCIDEIGKMFERLANGRAQNHERRVMDIMLELWGQGTMPWSGKDAASDEADRGRGIIWYPTLSLFGATTIEPFFRAMNEANVKDGMFARLLVVSVDDRPEEVENTADNFSKDLISAIDDCRTASFAMHRAGGNMGYLPGASVRPIVAKVESTLEALSAVKRIERWGHTVSEDDEEVSGVVNRAAEMTVRLASIRAISRTPQKPVADLADVKWAWTIVRRSMTFVAYGIARHMAGSEFEAIKKAMLRAVEKTGSKGLARWQLMKAIGVRHANPRDQVAALASLIETRDLREFEESSGGRPLKRYRLSS